LNVSIYYRKENPVSTQKNRDVKILKRDPVKKIENRIQPNTLFIVICTTTLCLAEQPRVYKAPEFEKNWSRPSLHPDRITLSPEGKILEEVLEED